MTRMRDYLLQREKSLDRDLLAYGDPAGKDILVFGCGYGNEVLSHACRMTTLPQL